jgi:coenzyme F420 hydrogenase subunit beta
MNCIDLKSSVIDCGLCCGCGACVGVCPADALSIDIDVFHEPVADESECTDCGLCLKVCPGKGYPVAEWAENNLDGTSVMIPERGPVRRFLAGYSADPEIRSLSASGGVATSLLIHLLESGQVDAVLVIGLENERQTTRLTDNPGDILDSMGSKYGTVPMLATLIPELMRKPLRVAGTFTPCQLAGWRLAAENLPRLRQSAVISAGLFCGYIQDHGVLEGLASTMGLEYPGGAKFTHWRYGPYPGSVRFELSCGGSREKTLYPWLDVAVPFYSLNRCLLCPDGGNWIADMALGDIHGGGTDETIIVSRTGKGDEVLDSAEKAGRIVTRDLSTEQVEQSVIRHITRSKLQAAIARISWLEKKGRPVPGFDYDILPKKLTAILQVSKYRLILWCRTGWRRSFLMRHPALMEKTGHFLYAFPSSIPGWRLLAGIRARFRSR